MSGSLKPAEFFVLEAGEYLERLATLVAKVDGPKPDELVRYSRALRGSALMASQPDFAGAAGGVEAVARAFRDGAITWTAEIRETASQAVEELKGLLRHAPQWSAEDGTAAGRIGRDLGGLAGQAPPQPHRRAGETGPDLNSGVRAFVAREGALIASALDRAARALRQDRTNMDPVHNVVRRMQSLRGLAELADLPPLPDVLDALELAAGDMTRSHAPPPDVADVFANGATAMTRLSRDVADRGAPTPDSLEAVAFTDAIIRTFALESDVVEVTDLAPEGEESVVTPGESGLHQAGLASVELVSQGEHLNELAHGLRRAHSASECRLRLYGLIEAVRVLGQRAGPTLAGPLHAILQEAKRLVDGPVETHAVTEFADYLQRAGAALGAASGVAPADVAGDALVPQPSMPPSPAEFERPPLAPAAVEEEVISIAALAPDPGPALVDSSDILPPADPADLPIGVGLAGGLRSYAQARATAEGPTPESFAEFLGGATSPAPTRTEEPGEPLVSVDDLLYSGEAAWTRAHEVRSSLTGRLRSEVTLEDVRPLVEELLDLLALASAPRR